MNVYSSADRVTRCVVAAAVLCGICFVYVNLSSRWLHVDHNGRKRPNRSAPVVLESVANQSVLKWFPEDAWVRQANKSFRDGRRYLFFNEDMSKEIPAAAESEIPGLSIDLKPIAIFFENEDPGIKPVFATADSARLTLSERFSAQQSTIGRIVSVWLTDNVIIQGPKELYITGHEFYVDEASMKLRSRYPVTFTFDGHSGHAKDGVEIELDGTPDNNRGLMSISGIKLMRLNGSVDCDLSFDGRHTQAPTYFRIQAPNGFEFDPRTNIGTFRGKFGGGDFRRTDVLVTRLTSGRPDQMWCSELTVEFHPEIDPETGKAKDSRLRLGRFTALGSASRPINYVSPEHDVRARMVRLNYLVGARRLDMFGSLQDGRSSADDKKQLVQIIQQDAELHVPHLRILHGDGTGIERIECRGRGFVRLTDTTSDETSEHGRIWAVEGLVKWKQQLNIQRGRDGMTQTVSIQGGGILSLPKHQMELKGRTINMTLLARNAATHPEESSALPEFSLSMTEVQPKKLIAQGDVSIRSPSVFGELKDQLTVYFHQHKNSSDNNVSVISRSRVLSSSAKDTVSPDETLTQTSQSHTTFHGREMTAHVVLSNESGAEQKWSSVRLTGDVQVDHHGTEREDEYSAEGSTFIAQNGLGDLADINLFGNPAILKSPTGHVSGSRIDLYQAEGMAEINGGGELKMVIDQDFDGKQLPSPIPMTVYWTDRMKVHGKWAHFVGGIRIVMDGVRYSTGDEQMHNTEILTPELEVLFVDPVSLTGVQRSSQIMSAMGQSSRSPEVDRIQCVGQTTIHQESFTDGEMDGLLDAEMVDLRIDPGTGNFSAIGPGQIESTTTSSGSDPIQPVKQIRVKANDPTEIRESPFARIRVTFIGSLKGNLNNREVDLRNFVNIAFAAVQDLDEEIDLESIPAEQMPEDSRILQAEEVHIMAIPGRDADGFSITALGNARLESRDLSGDADRITYDHSKSQIVLTGEEGRLVNGRYRPAGTGQLQNMKGPWFKYNLETRHLSARTIIFESAD